MAATRLRQAAARLASSVQAAASDCASSRARRFVGGTLAVGAGGAASSGAARFVGGTLAVAAGGAAGYSAAEWALSDTVPYGADGGRRRRPELWMAVLGAARLRANPWMTPFGPTTTESLAEHGLSEVAQKLGPDALAPLPAGQAQVHWIQPDGAGPGYLAAVYGGPYKQAVEASVQALVVALQQEAKEKGFGKHVLEHGFHVIVTPQDAPTAMAVPSNTIILPAGLIVDCIAFTKKPDKQPDHPAALAALQFVLAHELAHLYLQHGDEMQQWAVQIAGAGLVGKARDWARSIPLVGAAVEHIKPAHPGEAERAKDYQLWASEMQKWYWQQEFEADEVACALLARLRLPPKHWAAGFEVLALSVLWHEQQVLKLFGQWQQELSPEQKRQMAADLGFPNADFDAGVALRRAALDTGDADAVQRHQIECAAGAAWHQLQALSARAASAGEDGTDNDSGNGGGEFVLVGRLPLGPDAVEGDSACPAPAVPAFLADLCNTHPRFGPRITRINQLSGQLPMLLRAATPPVIVGGRYSHASVAEQVAEQLAAGLAAEAAKEAAAKAAEAAAQQAAAQEAAAKAAAGRATLAGSFMAGVAAAAAALKAACKHPS